jgi:sugar lactone lactonase YvrE
MLRNALMMPARKRWLRSSLAGLTLLGLVVVPGFGASAAPKQEQIVLPGASSTEGIAVGRGATFFAGDLFRGDIFRGNLQRGTAALFIDAPDGRLAVGMKVDDAGGLLFVAGGFTGQAYVYNTETGATVATYQFANPAAGTFINDVTITPDGAWFTDSNQPKLYFVPLGPGETLGTAHTLVLSGPAAATPAAFNLNGIAATPNGATLIVAHSGVGLLYTVNPMTGASAPIAGVSVPDVDGLLFEAGRLFAVQNTDNKVAVINLSSDLSSGVIEKFITSPNFHVPTTVARHGSQLALANSHFDTGIPPTATRFEVVIVDR